MLGNLLVAGGALGPDRLAKRHHKFPIHGGYGLGYAESAAPRGSVVILIAASELCPTQCGGVVRGFIL